jgi:hypothetical protein
MRFLAGEFTSVRRFWRLIVFDSLHRYLTDVVHVDIFWYIGSRLDVGPSILPALDTPIKGSSIVPWRYHFNTGEPEIRCSTVH